MKEGKHTRPRLVRRILAQGFLKHVEVLVRWSRFDAKHQRKVGSATKREVGERTRPCR